jgi:transposase
VIDRVIDQDTEKRTVTIGQAVKAMILNGLGFAQRALYLTPLFFEDKPVERLIGSGIQAAHLNDDVLGRALDAIYEYGPSKLYSQCAMQAVNRLGLQPSFGQFDSTSFHVDGEYNSNESEQDGISRITKGYSRDHRPDLNQVVLQLLCERQAGIPLLMETLSGNRSDKESFRTTVKAHMNQLQMDFKLDYIVADSALYVAETLKEMDTFKWISRVPETITLARDIIDTVAPDLMSQPGQSAFRSLGVVYADIPQHWVVVYSPEAHERTIKSVNKHSIKNSASELKEFEALCKQAFACEADARKAIAKFEKGLKATFLSDVRIESMAHFHGKGRPVKGRKPDFYTYHIAGAVASSLQQRDKMLQRKSCFILATNQLDCAVLPPEGLIDAYKDQQKVERGFRFLKDPLFMASTLFLKSPERIMALMMVMTLCLLVYAALERRIREALRVHNTTFPNQKGKPIANPTARWVFQFFAGIHVLVIEHVGEFVLHLNEFHRTLLAILGEPYQRLYSGDG